MSRRITAWLGGGLAGTVMVSVLCSASAVHASAKKGTCVTSQLSTSAMWDGSSATSLAGQVAAMQGKAWQGRGPTAWTFNYGPNNLDWVTNSAIGPAFAKAI